MFIYIYLYIYIFIHIYIIAYIYNYIKLNTVHIPLSSFCPARGGGILRKAAASPISRKQTAQVGLAACDTLVLVKPTRWCPQVM